MHISRKRSLRRALASIVTGALVASAAVVGIALPAAAAGVATVGVTEAPRAGGEVTVTGAGFDASGFGIYLSVRANDTATDSYTVWIDDTNAATSTPEGDTAPMSADGAFTLTVPVPAYSDAGYSIVTRGAHGIPTATNTTTTPIVYEAVPATATQTTLGVSPEATAEEGADVVLTATVSPAAAVGSVEFFAGTTSLGTAALTDGTASRTVSTLPVGALNLRAVFTPADAAVFAASASDAVPFTMTATTTEPETPTPTLTVSQSAGLDPASTTITVTGTGYDASAKGLYGPTAGKAAGFYAQIGWLAPTWRPSEGAASSARSNAYSVWVQGTETASPYLKWTDNGDGTASFTWTVTIDKATLDAKKLDGGTLSVFTTGAGGVVQAVNEKSVRLTWAANPALSVTPSSGLDADGTSVTVTGTGYDTTATGLYGPTAGKAAGFYAQIGWLAPTWRPSEGAASSARSNAYSAWVQGTETASPYLKWTDNGDGTASFTWTVTIDKATLDAKKLAGGTLSVFTTGAGGVVQAVNEKSVALAFASTPTLSVSQTTDLAATGSTITVTGTGYDASAKGLYGPTAGKAAGFYAQIGWLAPTWRPSEGAASSARSNAYSVWVQGTETASPYLKWTDNGDGTASFTWTVTIDKATLDAKKLDGGTLSVFTTGAGGVVQAVNEKSVALAFTEPKITVSSDTLQAGDTVTVSGIGFPAGELATVEIHSDPVTLGTALIGGTGAFSVTGIVPTTLQGTSHTIVVTAPGVSLSAPVTVTAAPAPVVEKVCVAQAVSGATIDWGMKQSFVSYINGPIAKGSVSGSWGTGSGAYNTADNRGSVTYSGTVRYTGHSGVLDLSLSQLRVQVNSTTSATLYASTSAGTIAIATLSLPAASVSADRISWSNASATLTSAGSQLFSYNGNAFYPAGTALDPVSFAFPLGAQVPCDSTTDGALAATGGGAPIDVAWIGLALLLLGIGTVAARRRARA